MNPLRRMPALIGLAGLLVACGDDGQQQVVVDGVDSGAVDAASDTEFDSSVSRLACADIERGDFATCGGIPYGLWRLETWCPAGDLYDPLDGTCDDIFGSGEGSGTGSLRIDSSGSFAWNFQRTTSLLSFSFALACYGGATSPCDGRNFDGTCSLAQGQTRCECDVTQAVDSFLQNGSVTRAGNRLTLDVGTFDIEMDYCVNPDTGLLEILRYQAPGTLPARMVYRRIE
jgi:hypothetical protein